jgi:chromosome segregation ATPase
MSEGDGLGFLGSLALWMVAADTITRDWPRMAAEAGAAARQRREIATQEDEINSIILQYNELVAKFNDLFEHYTKWREVAEKRSEKISQLQQELAAANHRASAAEASAADVQSHYEYYRGKYEESSFRGTQKNQRIRELEAEIEQRKNR